MDLQMDFVLESFPLMGRLCWSGIALGAWSFMVCMSMGLSDGHLFCVCASNNGAMFLEMLL